MSGGSLITILVTFTLLALLVSATRTAAREGPRLVLTYSAAWRGLVRALWAFPVAIAILSVAFPPDPEDRWIVPVAVAGFGALMVVMTLEVFRRRILVGEHGIEQRSAWSSPLVIAWKDVREVALNLSSEIEVRPQRGRAIRVSLWLSGLESFARALEQHAGHLPSTAKAVLRIRAFRA